MANSRALFLIAGNASGELNVTIRNCKGRSGKAPTCQFGVNAAGGTVANKVNAVLENNHFVNPADYGRCIDVGGPAAILQPRADTIRPTPRRYFAYGQGN